MDREYRYRRLFPMSDDEYLDEPVEVVEWMLQIAEARGDRPWVKEQQRGNPRSA